MSYDTLKGGIYTDENQRRGRINNLLRDTSTVTTANANRAADRARARGASSGGQNALESNIAYETGKATSGAVNNLNDKIDDDNRRALEYLESLKQQDEAAKRQMWAGIGTGVGSVLGSVAGGPVGAWLANKATDAIMPKNAYPKTAVPKPKPAANTDYSLGINPFKPTMNEILGFDYYSDNPLGRNYGNKILRGYDN